MKILPMGTELSNTEGSASGGVQTKNLHAWRLATAERIRLQKTEGVTQADLWKELSEGTNVGQRKILSKALADAYKAS